MKNIETVVDLQDLQSIPMKDHKATANDNHFASSLSCGCSAFSNNILILSLIRRKGYENQLQMDN